MPSVLSLWQTLGRLPQGQRLFSLAFARKAPYFATIRPLFLEIRPDRASLVVRDRRRVHNHLGTVHAIALCNGLEAAMGALAEASIPPGRRWIPKRMQVESVAKATGDVTCVAETDREQWTGPAADSSHELAVRVHGHLADGAVVIRGTIDLWVTPSRSRGVS